MTSPSNSAALRFLLAIGACHRRLEELALELSAKSDLHTVKHVVDMPEVPGCFRLEEYVDAELTSGDALSWCLEITLTEHNITVEADVRRIHANGQDVIEDIGTRTYSAGAEYGLDLAKTADRLCQSHVL